MLLPSLLRKVMAKVVNFAVGQHVMSQVFRMRRVRICLRKNPQGHPLLYPLTQKKQSTLSPHPSSRTQCLNMPRPSTPCAHTTGAGRSARTAEEGASAPTRDRSIYAKNAVANPDAATGGREASARLAQRNSKLYTVLVLLVLLVLLLLLLLLLLLFVVVVVVVSEAAVAALQQTMPREEEIRRGDAVY